MFLSLLIFGQKSTKFWKLDNPYFHTLCKIGKWQLLIAEEIGLPDVDCCKAQINYCAVTLKSTNGCHSLDVV